MSLLEAGFEEFEAVEKTTAPDGEGGLKISDTAGLRFMANARLDSSGETETAKTKDTASLYTITVKKSVKLEVRKIIRRLSDNRLFRIISDGEDNKTPDGAGLDMRQMKAEEWVMCDD